MGVSSRPLLENLYGEPDYDSDRESEFLGGLLPDPLKIIGGIGTTVGNILNPPPPRPPLPPVQVPVHVGGGVDTARIDTPRGSATLKLPEKVVTEDEFRATTNNLQEAINRNTARLNSTQKDIESLSQRVGVVVADTQRDLAKTRDEARAALSKLRREQKQRDTNNLMISMLMQQQVQRQFDDHKHAVSVTVGPLNVDSATSKTGTSTITAETTKPPAVSDNTALMFLPLMMGGGGGGEGDNTMMMMVMMMALGRP